ncbi:asparagine synthase (glutamine-hydrolyzing) [Nocardia carnea]|uniref:asparagine synthase (glutamine-hydrolyzing) n=1 Tax=Nocardia carnea TaxID=37328 RepID=UPI0024585658|nr:asparagine synthase (glutamine-hydrolyzing) [Nocardia carnea]
MCRIHGHLGGDPLDRTTMIAVAAAQRHGGPDAESSYLGAGWALGHVRLAVQGIDSGVQPFRLGPHLTCVYNGMIYNHEQLRHQLTGYGHHFDGTCDGDVLLPLYERYGDAFTSHLEGMYAIAIVDTRHGPPVLKLFADHAGMKSLYYYRTADGRGLRFASEIRALQQFPDFPAALDPRAVDRYFGGRAVWGPDTMFEAVKTLPPGHLVKFTVTGVLAVSQTSFPAHTSNVHGLDITAAGARLNELVRDEMARMLCADVPVCVITSGGLDSSYLTGVAAELTEKVATFNVAYTGRWPADERSYAEEVAAHCSTRHTQVELDPAAFPALIERFVDHLDQPNNAPHSLSTYGLFQAIRAAGYKVAITGDGADELFAGYQRFDTATTDTEPGWQHRYQDTMAAAPTSVLTDLYTPAYHAALTATGGLFSDQIADNLATHTTNGPDKLEALLRHDQYERFPYYILRRVDHLSMAHGVEARIPFLQPQIVGFAHQLPAHLKIAGGVGKAPIAAAAAGLIPDRIINRTKQPFTLPIAAMMRPGQPLFDMVGDIVLPMRRSANILDAITVKTLFNQQASGATEPGAPSILWSILILEMWLAVRGLTL